MDIQRINELLDDKDFAIKLANTSSIEDVQKLFSTNGVELSQDEVIEIIRIISEMAKIPEEELEDVVGGINPIHHISNETENMISNTGYVFGSVVRDGNELIYGSLEVPVDLIKTICSTPFNLDKKLIKGYKETHSTI